MTTPTELKRMNLEHFERLLARTSDPQQRARIEQLIEEERIKADSAYPAARSGWKPHV